MFWDAPVPTTAYWRRCGCFVGGVDIDGKPPEDTLLAKKLEVERPGLAERHGCLPAELGELERRRHGPGADRGAADPDPLLCCAGEVDTSQVSDPGAEPIVERAGVDQTQARNRVLRAEDGDLEDWAHHLGGRAGKMLEAESHSVTPPGSVRGVVGTGAELHLHQPGAAQRRQCQLLRLGSWPPSSPGWPRRGRRPWWRTRWLPMAKRIPSRRRHKPADHRRVVPVEAETRFLAAPLVPRTAAPPRTLRPPGHRAGAGNGQRANRYTSRPLSPPAHGSPAP